jgi:hypothetical protein
LALGAELARWRAAGRKARLWWRDDDARGVTPALERLLHVQAQAGAPLTLAVIPDDGLPTLARRLGACEGVTLSQHGADHVDRRGGGQAGEFADTATEDEIVCALVAGRRRLAAAAGLLPVFVPPWNHAHAALEAALARAGYQAWSAHARTPGGALLPRVDVELDLLRWRGGARFRGERRFLADLAEALAVRRTGGDWERPIGLLTHHLEHDARTWRFLARFLDWSAARPELEWAELAELLPGARRAR